MARNIKGEMYKRYRMKYIHIFFISARIHNSEEIICQSSSVCSNLKQSPLNYAVINITILLCLVVDMPMCARFAWKWFYSTIVHLPDETAGAKYRFGRPL